MKKKFSEFVQQALVIRTHYHSLEKRIHGSEWSVQEDVLAFLTDAALIGRAVMSEQQRWPEEESLPQLRHKLGECMWWLITLSERNGLDAEVILSDFLTNTSKKMKIDS